MAINPNYVSYALMIICGLLAINIYRLRRANNEMTESLTAVNEQLNYNAGKKGECETSLSAQKNAVNELNQQLEAKKKENADVQTKLTACQQELATKTQELEAAAAAKQAAEDKPAEAVAEAKPAEATDAATDKPAEEATKAPAA